MLLGNPIARTPIGARALHDALYGDADERLDELFDDIAYLMRYSKGAITEERAMKMPRWKRQRHMQALARLVRTENGKE